MHISEPPALMLRLDAISLSSSQSSLSPASPSPTSPFFQINIHGLLLDSLSFDDSSSSFLCSPLASLPVGVGVGVVSNLNLKYQHSLKVCTYMYSCNHLSVSVQGIVTIPCTDTLIVTIPCTDTLIVTIPCTDTLIVTIPCALIH